MSDRRHKDVNPYNHRDMTVRKQHKSDSYFRYLNNN